MRSQISPRSHSLGLDGPERRKTLWNNLAPYYKKEILLVLASESGLSPQARAEQLPPDLFFALFLALKKSGAERQR